MKKIKFKRKSKRIFFKKYFMIFVLFVFLITMSSAYALLNQELNVIGNVTASMVYTYYFEVPSGWNTSSMHAYLWKEGVTPAVAFPGVTMSSAGTSSAGKSVYKVEISSTVNTSAYYNLNYDHIIFTDKNTGSHQTIDIPLDKIKQNNNLFIIGTYESSTKLRCFFQYDKEREIGIYAYMWNDTTKQNNTTWPGIQIYPTSANSNYSCEKIGNTTYACTFDISATSNFDRIIFNGTGNASWGQTNNMIYPPDGQDYTYAYNRNISTETVTSSYKNNDFTPGYWKGVYTTPPTLTPSHSH